MLEITYPFRSGLIALGCQFVPWRQPSRHRLASSWPQLLNRADALQNATGNVAPYMCAHFNVRTKAKERRWAAPCKSEAPAGSYFSTSL